MSRANYSCIIHIICVTLLLFMCSCVSEKGPEQAGHNMSLSEWKKQYDNAQTPNEKRAVCISVIDNGLIHEGCNVSILDQIFGTSFSSKVSGVKKGQLQAGVIHLETRTWQESAPYPPTGGGYQVRPSQTGFVGWYLVVKYNYRGAVEEYYLSNRHK